MKQYTKMAILQSFEHLLEDQAFDKITVSALIRDCGISRNTFYYHFKDVYDLLEAWLSRQLGQHLQNGSGLSLQEGTKALLHACVEKKRVIYNILNSLSRDQLERYLFNSPNDYIISYVRGEAEGRSVRETDVKELADFCRFAFAGYFLRFVWNDMQDDIDSTVDQLAALFSEFVTQALDKAER